MALNRETVGRCYDPSPPFDVSRQKIREFAAERPADARPFENWRDDRGWPVEPLYHMLEELDAV